jgi:Ca2+:H+ antiporter
MNSRQAIALALLAFVPISAAAEHFHWGDGAVFLTAVLAILPLAVWLSTATEEISIALGPNLGALLNALFGNATELIIALTALRAGLVGIVKASITGTVMANLLLALGLSMLVGGIGRQEQTFQPVVARVNGSAMTLAVLAILIPSLTSLDPLQSAAGIGAFSRFVAWLLLLVYGLTLVFSLRTHRSLYEVAQLDLAAEIVAAETAEAPGVAGLEIAGLQTAGAELAGPEIAEAPGGHGHRPPLLPWFLVLLGATAGIAYESEMFVGVVETVSEGFGLSGLFTGVVLLPLLGGVAEYITAVGMARRNKMDLAVSVALGSTLLVALLVVPVLVLVGPALGHPLDLSFNPYELVAIATAVVVSNLASLDGRSDWLEGVLLLAAYVILAAGFFFQSTPIG